MLDYDSLSDGESTSGLQEKAIETMDMIKSNPDLKQYILQESLHPNSYISSRNPISLSSSKVTLPRSIVYFQMHNGQVHPIILADELGKSQYKVKRGIDVITQEDVALKRMNLDEPVVLPVSESEPKELPLMVSESPATRGRKRKREEEREVNALVHFNRYRGESTIDRAEGKGVSKKYVAQTLARGGNLSTYIKEMRDLSSTKNKRELQPTFEEIVNVGYLLCNAVQNYHDSDYLHRDIKPDNFMICKEDSIHIDLIDFGGMIPERDVAMDLDKDYGTQKYMAPELTTCGPSKSTDTYALGMSLAELFAMLEDGQFQIVKFKNKNEISVLNDIVTGLTKSDPKERISILEAMAAFEKLSFMETLIKGKRQKKID